MNDNDMNDHAKWVYMLFKHGYRKEMGVNIRWYQLLFKGIAAFASFIVLSVIMISFILWPIAAWVFDKMDDLSVKYDKYLAKKGIIVDKRAAFDKHMKDKGFSDPSREGEFVNKKVLVMDVKLTPARVFKLLSKHDRFYKWEELGLSKECVQNFIKVMGIKGGEYPPTPSIKIDENNLMDGEYKVKLTHTYVKDVYWETEYGKKLLELKGYQHNHYVADGEAYEQYGDKKDLWCRYRAGEKVTQDFVSNLSLEFYI